MKKTNTFLWLIVLIAAFSWKAGAQCTFTAPFGGATITSTVAGTSVTLSTCNYGGEYAPATFSVTGSFVFGSSVASDYITITDGSNNVLAFGPQPLAANIPTVGLYWVHFATSGPPTCGTQNNCRVTTVMAAYPPCTGMPSAGTVPASFSICPNTSAVITATGTTAASAIVYQWQQSPNGTTGWTNVTTGSGFNTSSLSTASLTALTYYRLVVTCTTSAMSATSSVLSVNPNNPVSLCYCNTNLGGSNCSGDFITNVSILSTGFNNTSACLSNTLNGTYSQFPPSSTTSASLMIGATYSISITTNNNNIESLWIDYNQNGIYEASEHTQVCLTSTASVATIATFTVPGTALAGSTGMRVRSRLNGNQNGPNDACLNMGSGECEDYVVTIVPATTCSGVPNAGTAISSSTLVCAGSVVNLSLSGATVASGLTYQWQSSPNGSTWTAIAGATTVPVSRTITAVTYFRCIVSCGTNTASSVAVQINIQPPPVAGVISGPNNVNSTSVNSYTVAPASGNLQWYQGTSSTGPWTAVSGATANISSIIANPPGVVYYAVIASYPGCLSDTTNAAYTVTVNPAPGDNVCNAIPLSIGTSTVYYKLQGCTTQSGEVVPPGGNCQTSTTWCNTNLDNTRWFTFIAPLSGHVKVHAPDFDTQVAIWKASNCNNLLSSSTATLISANDDDSTYTTSGGVMYSSLVYAACLTPGATYYIQLDSYSPATAGDSTRLMVTDMGSPLNASFTGLNPTYCVGGAATTIAPATQGGVFTIGTNTVTGTPTFSPSAAGNYTVSYSIYGCNTQSTTVVSVCTSVNELDNTNGLLNIYPNPAAEVLTVVVSNEQVFGTIEVYDIVGKRLTQATINQREVVLNVADLAKGVYVIRVNSKSGEVRTGRFVKN